jgi:hypothetical protein
MTTQQDANEGKECKYQTLQKQLVFFETFWVEQQDHLENDIECRRLIENALISMVCDVKPLFGDICQQRLYNWDRAALGLLDLDDKGLHCLCLISNLCDLIQYLCDQYLEELAKPKPQQPLDGPDGTSSAPMYPILPRTIPEEKLVLFQRILTTTAQTLQRYASVSQNKKGAKKTTMVVDPSDEESANEPRQADELIMTMYDLEAHFPRVLQWLILDYLLCTQCLNFICEENILAKCSNKKGTSFCSDKCASQHMQTCPDCLDAEMEELLLPGIMSRETDSDSDSYDCKYKNTLRQRQAANALRALSSLLAFRKDEKVEALLLQLIEAPTSLIAQQHLIKKHQELLKEEEDEDKVYQLIEDSKIQEAAALGLLALAPHLRLTQRKIYHVELLKKLLENVSARSSNLVLQDIREISLFAYWSEKSMMYAAKAEALLV